MIVLMDGFGPGRLRCGEQACGFAARLLQPETVVVRQGPGQPDYRTAALTFDGGGIGGTRARAHRELLEPQKPVRQDCEKKEAKKERG